jgi:hypothetical protein
LGCDLNPHSPFAPLASFIFLAVSLSGCSSGAGSSGPGVVDASVPVDAPTEPGVDAPSAPPADAPGTSDAPAGCGEFAGDPRFTCSKDGNSRGKCVSGTPDIEACPNGCLRETPPADDICMGTTDTLSCTGSYGTIPSQDGNYYISQFGCWVDPSGTVQTDPGDNCIPSCLSKAIAAGVCMPGDTGPQCEERVNWYTADAARFGCLARLRVTNPKTGKAVIAVALDYGPACTGENAVNMEVLDSSGRIDLELFGGPQGGVDHSLVHVVQVDPSYPLGPLP